MSKNMNMPAAALAVYLPEQWSRWLATHASYPKELSIESMEAIVAPV